MLAKDISGAVMGVEAYRVEIEVNAGGGDTNRVLAGLPDTTAQESTVNKVNGVIGVNQDCASRKGRLHERTL